MLLGSEAASDDAVERTRLACAPLMGLVVPGMHRLLAVEPYGDRVAFAFEQVEGVGLVHTVGVEGRPLLPTAAAAEVVAQVAEVLVALGPEVRNRGPEPTDLLVSADGRVVVSGFAGPYPMSPSMRAPKGDEGEAAAVYRLGVLLAHLLAGVAPSPAGERSGQEVVVRRTLIRIMARPGPALPERYGEWIRGMLAWDPSERPPLSTVADGLRKAAEFAEGPLLASWCAVTVPALRAAALKTPSNTPVPLSRATTSLSPSDDPTDMRFSFRGLGARPLDATPVGAVGREDPDDPTQEAPSSEAIPAMAVPTRPGVAEMPVRVGPPPQAIHDDVSLPSGFLDNPTDEHTLGERTQWLTPLTFTVYMALVGLLLSCALLLGAYLFWPAPHPKDDGPQLHDVLPN